MNGRRYRSTTETADKQKAKDIEAKERSRILDGREVLVAVNTSTQPIEQNVVVETSSQRFTALAGTCPTVASAPGSVRITLPALGYAVCDAR